MTVASLRRICSFGCLVLFGLLLVGFEGLRDVGLEGFRVLLGIQGP